MFQKVRGLIWGIEYGWYNTVYSFRIWADIMGSHYNDSLYVNYTEQERQDDYLFYFWDSLNDGMDGLIY